jgi:hypothetical protein
MALLENTVMLWPSRKEEKHNNGNKWKQDKTSQQIYLPQKLGREKWRDTE